MVELTREELLKVLDPDVARWFSRFKDLTPPQKKGIPYIMEGRNVLITSPTGSGKTLTAFIYIISELYKMAKAGKLKDSVYVIYISPLRSLNNDIERNLRRPLKEIEELIRERGEEPPEIRIGNRTGDTPQSARSQMLRKPPHILITTPESLALMITAPKFRERLRSVKWVIVDEVHSLCENKRGVHLTLSLERLEELTGGGFIRIGLSATIHPLEEVAKFLVGYNSDGSPRDCAIVDARFVKEMDLRLVSPVDDLINADAETRNKELYRFLGKVIENHRTTLIFTNTRSGAERVAYNLVKLGIVPQDKLGVHHSSLSREVRHDIEDRLKRGEVKCVVTSTSLELGIDIGYIDAVVQIGSPKSISRGLQRIGRSGHSLDRVSKGYFVCLELDDLVEDGVLISEAYLGRLDRVYIPKKPLDVLAQHIVGMALEKRWGVKEAYDVVRRAYPYRDLTWEEFIDVLKYLSGRYGLEDYRVYGKIWFDEETMEFGRRGKLLRAIYSMNIGTIPENMHLVVYSGRDRIGLLEEEFVEHLDVGDIFVLSGRTYKYLGSKGDKVFVEPADGQRPTVPAWISEMLPLSFDLGEAVARYRYIVYKMVSHGYVDEAKKFVMRFMRGDKASAENLVRYVEVQAAFLRNIGVDVFHSPENIIVERFVNEEDGLLYLIFHGVFGRRANSVLARAYALQAREILHTTVKVLIDDHAFGIAYPRRLSRGDEVDKILSSVDSNNLRELVTESVLSSHYIRRIFRHVANRGLMILRYYKGKKTRLTKQQLSSEAIFDFIKSLKDFPLLKEAVREVIEDKMDVASAEKVLKDVEAGRRRFIVAREYDLPSPFAHNLILRAMEDVVLMEDRVKILQRFYNQVLVRIGRDGEEAV